MDCRISASARVTVFPKVEGLTLIRITGAHTDITDISSLDYIVQSMHDLLLGGIRIQPMTCAGKCQRSSYVHSQLYPTLQNIDGIQLQPLEAGLYRIENVLDSGHLHQLSIHID